MNAIKRHPLFTAWVALCLALFTAGFFWQERLRQIAHRELNSLAKKQQQRAQLLADAQSSGTLDAELSAASRGEAVTPVIAASVPRKPLDAFIAIAGAKEEMRRLAGSQAVGLLADESFGFAAYAHAGPQEKDLEAVHEQLGLIRLVVEKLFAAHPERLLAVRRESLRTGERSREREVADDFFAFAAGDGCGSGGWAVRVEFTGRTPALRLFLNSLASAAEPLVVRGVAVEPMRADQKLSGPLAKFSVIVQWAKPGGDRAVAGEIASPWTTPNASGELFNPPDIVRPPGKTVSVAVGDGCELLAVKREPYRLQLAGYFGAPGNYTATLVSPGSPETWHVSEGRRCEALGLTLKQFSLQRIGSGFEPTACAQIWDERKQELVTLVAHELRLTDTPLAVLRFGPPPGRSLECRIGDTFQDGSATCRIERIQLEPAEVVLAREQPGEAEPKRLILKPTSPASPKLSSVYPSP